MEKDQKVASEEDKVEKRTRGGGQKEIQGTSSPLYYY